MKINADNLDRLAMPKILVMEVEVIQNFQGEFCNLLLYFDNIVCVTTFSAYKHVELYIF